MAALYTDPDLIRRAEALDKRGRTRAEIAEELEISKHVVRKMFDPDYAEAERARLNDVDRVRAPARREDPAYRAYKAEVDGSDAHRARVRQRKAEREGRVAGAPRVAPADPEGMAAVATAVAGAETRRRIRATRVTAEDRRRAAHGTVRGTVNLSVEASVAANRLMAVRGCTWDELVEALILAAGSAR